MFFSVSTWKLKIIYVASIVFLLLQIFLSEGFSVIFVANITIKLDISMYILM